MLKTKLFALIFLYCIVSESFANHYQIRNYIAEHFPSSLSINEAQISQLAWALAHTRPTNDMEVVAKGKSELREISRALTRVYCAQLLRDGTWEAYREFVAAQLEANLGQPLSFASFSKISEQIQNLSSLDYELVKTAAILSAVSLSQPATELAHNMQNARGLNDKMDFLAQTLRNNSNIYPVLKPILDDNTQAKKLLFILFPPETNFRHMLYTEGGIGMFKYLRQMINHGFIDREELSLWYAHWIVNIAGFRGHINTKGSLYLQESTAQSMFKLQSLIYEMLEMPNFDPLVPYLEYRAANLGFSNLPLAERLFNTHLACLLRIYNEEEARRLNAALSEIPSEKIAFLKRHFQLSMQKPQPTPLHAPALFANALELTNYDLSRVLSRILPVYNDVLQLAESQKVSANIAFDQLASTVSLKSLLRADHTESIKFMIQLDGTALLCAQERDQF